MAINNDLYAKEIFKFWLKERRVTFQGNVESYRVETALDQIKYLSSKSGAPITLQITSHGGYVDFGLALYDYIKSSKVPIYTHCTGVAASMASILLAGGKKGHRTASKNARIMIHEPAGMSWGRASDVQIQAKEMERMHKQLGQILSQDTGQSFNKIMKDMSKDFWMTPEEALEYGLIDKIS